METATEPKDQRPARRKATPEDWAYMRRIGAYKAQSHREALEAHLALPLSERLKVVSAIIEGGPHFPGKDDEETLADRSLAEAKAFYDLARKLGLYRG